MPPSYHFIKYAIKYIPQQTKNCLYWTDPAPVATHGQVEPEGLCSPSELSKFKSKKNIRH